MSYSREFSTYAAERLAPPKLDGRHDTQAELHCVIGMAGEIGELLDAYKKHAFYGQPLDRENVIEELGDIMFYAHALMFYLDLDLEEIINANRKKLDKRYPKGHWDAKDARERKDKRRQSGV